MEESGSSFKGALNLFAVFIVGIASGWAACYFYGKKLENAKEEGVKEASEGKVTMVKKK